MEGIAKISYFIVFLHGRMWTFNIKANESSYVNFSHSLLLNDSCVLYYAASVNAGIFYSPHRKGCGRDSFYECAQRLGKILFHHMKINFIFSCSRCVMFCLLYGLEQLKPQISDIEFWSSCYEHLGIILQLLDYFRFLVKNLSFFEEEWNWFAAYENVSVSLH